MDHIETIWLPHESHPRRLELRHYVCATPSPPREHAAILFVHGAFCSARDFGNFLFYLGSRGHPAYAVSLRGHGRSWTSSWFYTKLWTSIDDMDSDIRQALDYVRSRHALSRPPILAGHSLGGGYVQYTLAKAVNDPLPSKVSGLVLLAAAPLSGGGKEIMANWEDVETDGKGYGSPLAPRAQLDTKSRVRKAFFSDSTDDVPVQQWLRYCRTETESLRVGLAVLWPFGRADHVLDSIQSVQFESTVPKVLFISSPGDRLVTTSMVEANLATYQRRLVTDCQQLAHVRLQKGGHHLMMDIAWEECANAIVKWTTAFKHSGRLCHGSESSD